MPQLDPSPWLMMLVLSWLALVSLVIFKVNKHKFPNNPTPLNKDKPNSKPWAWPWS